MGAYNTYLCEYGEPKKIGAFVRLCYDRNEKNRISHYCTPGKPDAGNSLDYNTLQLFHCYYLGALRDSTRDLMSTKNNLLGKVIKRKIEDAESEDEIKGIINNANDDLLKRNEVIETKKGLNDNLGDILKRKDYNIDVKIEESRIDYIVNVIKPFIPLGKDNSIRLWQNSLGYNNLIYIATVLSDIKDNHKDDQDSIYSLLIEEPEAHLHPQLQINLYDFLNNADNNENSQLFITSHSPSLTSRIPLKNLIVLKDRAFNVGICFEDRVEENIIRDTTKNRKLNESDVLYLKKMLERYLDVTRSQLLYAKGCIFIEGISESQLLETFSKILGNSLSDNQIEVVNSDSTAFYQFLMLYNSSDEKKRLPHKVAFITDGDQYTDSKHTSLKNLNDNNEEIARLRENLKAGTSNARVDNLKAMANRQYNIKICDGFKTLEYQICFANIEDTVESTKENDLYKFLYSIVKDDIDLFSEYINSLGSGRLTTDNKIDFAIILWKCIPQKSAFAQELSYYLDEKLKDENYHLKFNIPPYIINAINHVIG
jgi:putative ATP-dependent endonuclease of OLD family